MTLGQASSAPYLKMGSGIFHSPSVESYRATEFFPKENGPDPVISWKSKIKIKQHLPAGVKYNQKLLWFLDMVIDTVLQALTVAVKNLSRISASSHIFSACL